MSRFVRRLLSRRFKFAIKPSLDGVRFSANSHLSVQVSMPRQTFLRGRFPHWYIGMRYKYPIGPDPAIRGFPWLEIELRNKMIVAMELLHNAPFYYDSGSLAP